MNLPRLLDALIAPQQYFLNLPPVISMTILGLILTGILACAGFVLARMGYKPLWALLLPIPYLSILAAWLAAYRTFPREKL